MDQGFDRTEAKQVQKQIQHFDDQLSLYRNASPHRSAKCEERLKRCDHYVEQARTSTASPYTLEEAKGFLAKARELFNDRIGDC